jgi:transglutaminase-like putative cysteine protease
MKTTVKSILFPCLLSFVTAMSVFYVYEDFSLFNIFAQTLPLFTIFTANFFLFIVYEKLRIFNKTWFSTIIILIFLFAAIIAAGRLIEAQGRVNLFRIMDWFFKTGGGEMYLPYFTAALMVLYTLFISSTVFYFTNVRYNSFFVMLTCMTTFALYAKTFTDIPLIFPSLIIALLLFVSIEKRWYAVSANKALSYPKFITAGLCFVAVSAYVAGLFPPAVITPYREQFDDFISGGALSRLNLPGILLDSDISGAVNRTADDEYILFTVSSYTPMTYLRRQVFDSWQGENWVHTDSSHGYDTWLLEYFFGFERQDLERHYAQITVMTDIETYFLPMPANSFSIDYPDLIIRSIRDEFFSESGRLSRQGITYTAGYHDSAVASGFFHTNQPFYYSINEFEYPDYLNSTLLLLDYPRKEQVRELAAEITRDSSTDFEKAAAIENYFYNGEFKYDLNFVPQSKAVDYFLFDSKTGTCTDFATAMTILAREAGLPARYVEGYILQEQDEFGVYTVKLKHSHAFAEVFINGWGWLIFEPTIPADPPGEISYSTVLAVLISAGALTAGVIVFLIFALPRIKERAFRKKAVNSPREKQVQLFYDKIYSELMKNLRIHKRVLSSRDLDAYAALQYSVNLKQLTENYDKIVYGGIPAAEGDFYGIYMEYFGAVKDKAKNKM